MPVFKRPPVIILSILLVVIVALGIASAQDQSGQSEPRPSSYTVKYGDTLDQIGQRFNVSVVAIKRANNITNKTIIRPGDVLVIPPDAPAYGVYPANESSDQTAGQGGGGGEVYVIQPGDVLDVIAQKKNVSLQAILQANHLSGKIRLVPGDTIIIPADAPPYGVAPLAVNDNTAGQGGGGAPADYVVQYGDTLDHIAAQHNIQTACLIKTNNIQKRELILPGRGLIIDTTCPPYDGYDVVPNQTPTSNVSSNASSQPVEQATTVPVPQAQPTEVPVQPTPTQELAPEPQTTDQASG